MPYKVFALKWRPKNFDEVVGQPHIILTLKNAIQKNRIASAYLFAGPRGVGKTTTARILAKSLNCQNGPTDNPCNACSGCSQINDGRSLDVIEIDGASNRGIDEIRVLRENVKFAPVCGKFKIYIIDEVHMLTTEAFNALLKTLEEPPPYVKFIFATTNPNKVIPTILSRCQRFDFKRISVLEMVEQLQRIASAEKIDVDKEVLYALARSSDGSLRDAESVLDQLVSFSKDRLVLNDVVSMLGLVDQEALFELTEQIIRKDSRAALALFNRLIDNGKDMSVFLASLIEHFRNLMVSRVSSGDPKLVDLPAEICEKLLEQSRRMGLEEIFLAFNTLVSAQEMAKRIDSLRIPLEVSLIKLTITKDQPAQRPQPRENAPAAQPQPQAGETAQKKQFSKGQLLSAADIREKIFSPVPKKENGPEVQGMDAQPAKDACCVSLELIKGAWQKMIDSLAKVKMSTSTYLSEGQPLKVQGNVLTVSFPKTYSLHKESLESRENRALIEKCLCESCNAQMRVNFILSSDTPARQEEDSQFLKSAIELFGGRVVREG